MTNALEQVKKDMKVYDAHGAAIGRVKDVQFGSGGTTPDTEDEMQPGLPLTVAASPDRSEGGPVVLPKPVEELNLPEEVHRRLQMDGYVRLDAGLLRADRLVLPDQIASVDAEGVRLGVTRDGLLKA